MAARFSDEEIARSGYKAFCWASGLGEQIPWEEAAPHVRDVYLRAAKKVTQGVDDWADMPLASIALRVLDAVSGDDALVNRDRWEEWLPWEACVRQMCSLAVADEDDQVNLDERSWGPWVEKKLRQSVGA